jgi:hypothetical protein
VAEGGGTAAGRVGRPGSRLGRSEEKKKLSIVLCFFYLPGEARPIAETVFFTRTKEHGMKKYGGKRKMAKNISLPYVTYIENFQLTLMLSN